MIHSIQENEKWKLGFVNLHTPTAGSLTGRSAQAPLWLSPQVVVRLCIKHTSEEVLVVIGSVTVIITIVIKEKSLKRDYVFQK